MMNILLPEVADFQTLQGTVFVFGSSGYMCSKSFFAGFVHMFASDGGAQSIGWSNIDSLDINPQGGADSVVTMFGFGNGMEQFVIGWQCSSFSCVTNHLFL